jgi:hypothetical protein
MSIKNVLKKLFIAFFLAFNELAILGLRKKSRRWFLEFPQKHGM